MIGLYGYKVTMATSHIDTKLPWLPVTNIQTQRSRRFPSRSASNDVCSQLNVPDFRLNNTRYSFIHIPLHSYKHPIQYNYIYNTYVYQQICMANMLEHSELLL